jgi:arylsulfatase A-like enzyme
MTRRSFCLAAPAVLSAKTRRPNVIWFMPDQWRGMALGCMGDPNVKTPHLDAMAREGLLIRNMLANTPVCCPARSILMTGQYCHRNGMTANDLRLREDHVSLPKLLRGAGYRTGFIGKWHLDGGQRMPGFVPPGPRRQGFEWWAANECSHDHFHAQYFRDEPSPIRMDRFEAEGWTDLALEFLEGQKKDERPFFLAVYPGPPHDPYGAPEEYTKQYDPAQLQLRANYRAGERVPGRKQIADYYAACTAVDAQLGRLLAALDRSGRAEDTVVMFFSDHGDMLGSHGMRLKRKPQEESIRVPGIVRYPRYMQRGRVIEGMVSHVDLPATTLSLCGVQVPRNWQGENFAPVIRGQRDKTQESTFFQIFGPFAGDGTPEGWRGVRTDRYMYARFESKPWVLFDLVADPYEMNNLVADPAARKIVAQMEARLAASMRRTGDRWDYNWTAPVEDGGRLYNGATYGSVAEYLKAHPQSR